MVEPVTQTQGRIVIPDAYKSEGQMWRIGRVIAVGDGRQPASKEPEPPVVGVGDLVYFQTNAILAASQSHERGNTMYLNLHQGDLIGKLSSAKVCYENFTPLGRWLLLRPKVRKLPGGILLPDNTRDVTVDFHVCSIGTKVDLPLRIGQQVLVNTGRACAFAMSQLDLTAGEEKMPPSVSNRQRGCPELTLTARSLPTSVPMKMYSSVIAGEEKMTPSVEKDQRCFPVAVL